MRIWTLIALFAFSTALLAADEKPKPSQRDKKEQGAPLPLDQSAKAMTLPDGFTATLVAGEPDVHQPIGLTVDHRGRLWVCENDSYPKWEEHGKDRIVIFEDVDGDGTFKKRTVFAEGFHYITSVQMAAGGVYVMDCPNLLFFPVKDGEDKPSGEPQVILDGWNWKGVHNLPNSLTWGPDGWLYGCHGITVDSLVSAPGTPDSDRTKVSCGVWRYHPTKKLFEYICAGTTNPWGLDYDERGQLFMSNNVVAHLWHVIQGSHYERMHGKDINPYSFELMQTCADHLHWGGGAWTSSRSGEQHSIAGGGHSHAGLMIYYGDAFPPEYRGTLFMGNTHGHRLNNDSLARKGSGYAASHRPDFLMANDKWFKAVSVMQGPAGDVFCIDWSDTGECHDYDVTDRDHARLYRVAYKGTKPVTVDLTKESDDKLVDLQTSSNEWYVRHARIVLRDRGPLQEAPRAKLAKLFAESKDPVHRLRAMWTLHACGSSDESGLLKATADSDEYVRAWAIQLLAEDKKPSTAALEKFATLAKDDPSPFVRLYLASAMQRTPLDQRKPILETLCAHEEDATDANLPLMYYYALEPVIGADPKAAAALLPKLKIPKVRELTVRRMTANPAPK